MKSVCCAFVALIVVLMSMPQAWSLETGRDWAQTPQPWTTPWTARGTHTSVVFQDRLWIIGGHSQQQCMNDVWSSHDGVNWVQVTPQAPWSARMRHTSVVFDGHIWVIGGRDNDRRYHSDVWRSADGANWELVTAKAPWTKRRSHRSVVHDGKIWVMGGYTYPGSDPEVVERRCLNDVWYSTDGKNWVCATEAAPWTPRYRHGVLTYQGRMWIIGGAIGRTTDSGKWDDGWEGDVWTSSNGKQWDQALVSAPWAARSSHSAVVHDNAMWIFGGRDPQQSVGDVWRSTDGLYWTEITAAADWPVRYNHTTVSWHDRLWLVGGLVGDQKKKANRNDVWCSPPIQDEASTAQGSGRIPDSNVRQINKRLGALVQDNPLQDSLATRGIAKKMQGQYVAYFHPTYSDRQAAYSQWLSATYTLVANITGWKNAIVATCDDDQVRNIRDPQDVFLAGASDQRCVFVFNNGMSTLLPELRKATVDLGAGGAIRLRVDPAKPALFSLRLAGLRTGTHRYPLVLLAADGKTLYDGTVKFTAVTPGRITVCLRTAASEDPTEALLAVHSDRGAEFVPDTTPYYPHEQVVLRRPAPAGWPVNEDRLWASRGEIDMLLPPGPVRIIASKGPEYRRVDTTVEVTEGKHLHKTLVLKRFTDMPAVGWYSGDDHCHIGRTPSRDADIMDVLAAQDIHVTHVVQMGDVNGLYFLQSSWADSSHRRRGSHLMVSGQEDPRTTWRGHALILNNRNTIYDGDNYYVYEDAFAEAHRQGGLTGYAHAAFGFQAELGASVSIPNDLLDFIEVQPVLTQSYDVVYHFWKLGFQVTLAAGSDFPWGGLPGNPRFYTYVDGEFSFEKYMSAMQAGHTFVSGGGAFIDTRLDGQLPGSTLSCQKGTTLDLSFTARVNPDFDTLDRVEVVRNGDIVQVFKPRETRATEMTGSGRIPIDESCWVAVRVYGKKSKGRGGPSYLQYRSAAHTTPFYVEVGGKAFWKRSELPKELERAEKSVTSLEEYVNSPTAAPDLDPAKMEKQAPRLRGYINKARDVYHEIRREGLER